MAQSADSNEERDLLSIKILILGDLAVGKTSLMLRYTKDVFSHTNSSTLGVDFKQKEVIVGKSKYVVQIWDTAGQERFRSLTKTFYRKADGIILAFDCTNYTSFSNVTQWVQSINPEIGSQIPVVLASTKNDSMERVISSSQAKELAKEIDAELFETSAKLNIKVQELFDFIIAKISSGENILKRSESKVLNRDLKIKKKKCCE